MADPIPLAGPSELAAAIARVAGAVEAPPKSGRHPQGWQFATYDDLLAALRPLLAAEGLAIRMGVDRTPGGCVVEQDGKLERWRIRFRFTITHAPSGEAAVDYWWGQAFDASDKASTKAATAAHKHWLRHTFAIGTGEADADPDAANLSAERARRAQDADAEAADAAWAASRPTTARPEPGPAWMTADQHAALAAHGWGGPRNPQGAMTRTQREALQRAGLDFDAITTWGEADTLLAQSGEGKLV